MIHQFNPSCFSSSTEHPGETTKNSVPNLGIEHSAPWSGETPKFVATAASRRERNSERGRCGCKVLLQGQVNDAHDARGGFFSFFWGGYSMVQP